MRKLNNLIAIFNNSVIQKKNTFKVPKSSLNYRVLCFLWKKNYLSAVVDDGFCLTVTHRIDSDGNTIVRKIQSLYARTGRKLVSVRHDVLRKVTQYRGGDTLLLVSKTDEGIMWANDAYREKIGGILLLQIYY